MASKEIIPEGFVYGFTLEEARVIFSALLSDEEIPTADDSEEGLVHTLFSPTDLDDFVKALGLEIR